MWYRIRKKSFISNGERNLTKQYLNLTRKDWLSATVCDTYKIEDCDKFRAKIKYFKKDLMIDLSSFVSQIILFRPFYIGFPRAPRKIFLARVETLIITKFQKFLGPREYPNHTIFWKFFWARGNPILICFFIYWSQKNDLFCSQNS